MAVQFAEIGKTSRAHPHDKVFIRDISPLDFVPISVVKSFKFILAIRLPSNVGLIQCKCSAVWIIGYFQREIVGEQWLGNQTTGVGRCWLDKRGYTICSFGYVGSQVWVFNDRVAISSEIFDGLFISQKLPVRATAHVSSMILVKIVELVINVQWLFNVTLYF